MRERYASTARSVRGASQGANQEGAVRELDFASGGAYSCCGPSSSSCCGFGVGLDTAGGRTEKTGGSCSEAEKGKLPRLATDASLGCGNLVALATLSPGEVVLDLGSGGGIDVLLSARRLAPGSPTGWT